AASLFGSRAVRSGTSPRAARACAIATPSRPVAPTTSTVLPRTTADVLVSTPAPRSAFGSLMALVLDSTPAPRSAFGLLLPFPGHHASFEGGLFLGTGERGL